jgi:hypothetical protein
MDPEIFDTYGDEPFTAGADGSQREPEPQTIEAAETRPNQDDWLRQAH